MDDGWQQQRRGVTASRKEQPHLWITFAFCTENTPAAESRIRPNVRPSVLFVYVQMLKCSNSAAECLQWNEFDVCIKTTTDASNEIRSDDKQQTHISHSSCQAYEGIGRPVHLYSRLYPLNQLSSSAADHYESKLTKPPNNSPASHALIRTTTCASKLGQAQTGIKKVTVALMIIKTLTNKWTDTRGVHLPRTIRYSCLHAMQTQARYNTLIAAYTHVSLRTYFGWHELNMKSHNNNTTSTKTITLDQQTQQH